MKIRLKLSSLVVLAAVALSLSVRAADDPAGWWIVLASRQDRIEAEDLALAYARTLNGVRVARARNDWFAVLAGPTQEKTIADARAALEDQAYIPDDAYLGRLDGFLDTVLQAPSSPVLAVMSYREGPAKMLQHGPLTVRLDSKTGSDGTRIPAISVQVAGHAPFETELTDVEMTGLTWSKTEILRLDPSRALPQIVFSAYSGGAHCCTLTRILTTENGDAWSEIDMGAHDGGGFEFEDAAGDGAAEIIGIDDRFLYEFDSYAGSFAPPRVYRVAGPAASDVTAAPAMRPLLERELRQMEREAEKDPDLWGRNGYLAAWVALKALLGEGDAGWARMLQSYEHDPDFGPETCREPLPLEKCPKESRRKLPFPEALRTVLAADGYPVPASAQQGGAPKSPGH